MKELEERYLGDYYKWVADHEAWRQASGSYDAWRDLYAEVCRLAKAKRLKELDTELEDFMAKPDPDDPMSGVARKVEDEDMTDAKTEEEESPAPSGGVPPPPVPDPLHRPRRSLLNPRPICLTCPERSKSGNICNSLCTAHPHTDNAKCSHTCFQKVKKGGRLHQRRSHEWVTDRTNPVEYLIQERHLHGLHKHHADLMNCPSVVIPKGTEIDPEDEARLVDNRRANRFRAAFYDLLHDELQRIRLIDEGLEPEREKCDRLKAIWESLQDSDHETPAFHTDEPSGKIVFSDAPLAQEPILEDRSYVPQHDPCKAQVWNAVIAVRLVAVRPPTNPMYHCTRCGKSNPHHWPVECVAVDIHDSTKCGW